jgi:hypothetical protein
LSPSAAFRLGAGAGAGAGVVPPLLLLLLPRTVLLSLVVGLLVVAVVLFTMRRQKRASEGKPAVGGEVQGRHMGGAVQKRGGLVCARET